MISNLVRDTFSLLCGLSLIPVNILVHEMGHYTASKLVCNESDPIIVLKGFAWTESYVASGYCTSSELLNWKFSHVMISAGGPLVEAIAIFAITKLLGGRHSAIAALPHVAHLTASAVAPLLGAQNGDFAQVLAYGGLFVYIASFTGTMIIAHSIIAQITKEHVVSGPMEWD